MDEARRREADALLALTDAAMRGTAQPPDFAIEWRNDFLKAQPGTFVPFTISVDTARVGAMNALLYLRVARRGDLADGPRNPNRFPFEAVFPVEVVTPRLRVSRGFTVPAGDYDVYVALRERTPDVPRAEPTRLRFAVLKQPLSAPDFWTGTLAASTVMLADRIDRLAQPLSGDALFERPYAIGDDEVTLSPDAMFGKNRELLVVFLIYDPVVGPDRGFDVRVDYQLFAKSGAGQSPATPPAGEPVPAARPGERYVSSTNPQRLTRYNQAAGLEPSAGQPLIAGQGIPLSSFDEGEYRLGITVTDVLSRRTLSRDVTFTVVGS